MHDGETEAGVDATSVDVDGACAALAVVAAFLGAEQLEVIAEGIEECDAGLEANAILLAVDVEGDGDRAWSCG
jgi:hypothetical protein